MRIKHILDQHLSPIYKSIFQSKAARYNKELLEEQKMLLAQFPWLSLPEEIKHEIHLRAGVAEIAHTWPYKLCTAYILIGIEIKMVCGEYIDVETIEDLQPLYKDDGTHYDEYTRLLLLRNRIMSSRAYINDFMKEIEDHIKQNQYLIQP